MVDHLRNWLQGDLTKIVVIVVVDNYDDDDVVVVETRHALSLLLPCYPITQRNDRHPPKPKKAAHPDSLPKFVPETGIEPVRTLLSTGF